MCELKRVVWRVERARGGGRYREGLTGGGGMHGDTPPPGSGAVLCEYSA